MKELIRWCFLQFHLMLLNQMQPSLEILSFQMRFSSHHILTNRLHFWLIDFNLISLSFFEVELAKMKFVIILKILPFHENWIFHWALLMLKCLYHSHEAITHEENLKYKMPLQTDSNIEGQAISTFK